MARENKTVSEWQELTKLTQGQAIVMERVRLAGKDVAIEGAFELPQLARLGSEDQVFVAAFLKSHNVAQLGTYVDTDLALLHAFGAYGLPTTVLIDPSGKEIAKAEGPGEWASPASIAYFKDLTKS